MGYGREPGSFHQDFGNEQGFSIFRMDEVRHAAQLAEQSFIFQQLVAEFMLRGIGTGAPWESGRCVDLTVTSDPARRRAVRPNTAFDLEALPRARADGAPAGGTVRATLEGGASLQPSSGKVPADAKYGYAGPDQPDQEASISFEARSKRGVGRATLAFDTKPSRAYRITGIGDCPAPTDVCDTTRPFTYAVCGGTMTHVPTDRRSGTHRFTHSGATGSGTYVLTGPEEEMTGTYRNTTCAMGRCFATPAGKATWTRIEPCD
jgi:hypothetical protein